MPFLSDTASLSSSLLHWLQEEKDESGEELMGQSQASRMGPPWSQEVSGLSYDSGVISSLSKVLYILFDHFLQNCSLID